MIPARTTIPRRAEARVASALKALANALLAELRLCLWPRRRPAAPRRVCIYRIGNVGDTACAVPAMYAIRRAWPAVAERDRRLPP
jgi:hypothetical protein